MIPNFLAYTIIAILIPIIIFLSLFFVIPWFFGAPYEGTKKRIVKKIISEGKINNKTKAVELGSGDGRIVIALAKAGAQVDGYEINPILVYLSRYRIKQAGVQDRAKIYQKSFWDIDLSKYNTIVLFQFKTVIGRLAKKFKKELTPKTKIISHYWKLPNWHIKKKIGKIYFYEK